MLDSGQRLTQAHDPTPSYGNFCDILGGADFLDHSGEQLPDPERCPWLNLTPLSSVWLKSEGNL